MAGYERQDTSNNISNGNVIDADDFDNEYNAIKDAFNASTGHKHDGSVGEGAPITKVGPAQDVVVSSSSVLPKSTNTLDVGSSGVKFKDGFFSGAVNSATVAATGNVSVGGNLTVTGDATISGNLTFGNAATDTIDFQADVNSNIKPEVTGTFSLGSSTQQWNNLWLDGTANVDTLTVDENATVAGTLAVTGVTTATAGVVGDVTGDVTGNLTGNVTGNVTGNSDTATALGSSRTISLSGDVTGSVSFDGTQDVTITTTQSPASVTLGSDTSGDYVKSLVAGTGIVLTNNSGEGATPTVAIGQAVSTSSDVTFNDLTVAGNLTVSGTTTTVNTETINLADNLITLNSNEAGTPTQNGGIEIERGTEDNKTLVWNETDGKWTVGSETFVAGTFEGDVTGNADTATTLETARTIAGQSFDGSANISIAPTDLTGVTSSAAEINKLDGYTGSATDLNEAIAHYVPTGGIIMWSGSVVSIPTGWVICDGTNSTPDLRNRFVVGAGGTYAVDATGGSADAVIVSHTHTATVTDAGHSHSTQEAVQGNGADGWGDGNIDTLGAYPHISTANSGTTASATTGVTVANSTEGVSGTNANLPPYYALAYIMKT